MERLKRLSFRMGVVMFLVIGITWLITNWSEICPPPVTEGFVWHKTVITAHEESQTSVTMIVGFDGSVSMGVASSNSIIGMSTGGSPGIAMGAPDERQVPDTYQIEIQTPVDPENNTRTATFMVSESVFNYLNVGDYYINQLDKGSYYDTEMYWEWSANEVLN